MASSSAKSKKPSKPEALAQRVLEELARLRESGTPVTVRSLAERCGQPPETFAKTLTSKALKEKLVIAKKTPDSPVVLIDDAHGFADSETLLRFAMAEAEKAKAGPWLINDFLKLPKLEKAISGKFAEAVRSRVTDGTLPASLAAKITKPKPPLNERIIAALSSAKAAGNSYPTSTAALARELGEPAEAIAKALAGKSLQEKVVIAKKTPDAPVGLIEDATLIATSERLLAFAVSEAEKAKPGPWKLEAFLKLPKLDKAIATKFAEAVKSRATHGTLSPLLADKLERKISAEELAGSFLRILESQRRIGPQSYPVAGERLVELCDLPAKADDKKKALKDRRFTAATLSLKSGGRTLYCLQQDASQVARGLIEPAFDTMANKPAKVRSTGFTPEEIAGAIGTKKSPLYAPLLAELQAAAAEGRLPASLGCVLVKGKPIIFRLAAIQGRAGGSSSAASTGSAGPAPQAARPPEASKPNDFASAFESAFDRLNAGSQRNLVPVLGLRKALPQFDRTAFDAGLRKLRESGRFTMDSADGNTRSLTPEEMEASIVEGGSRLVYVARKDGARG